MKPVIIIHILGHSANSFEANGGVSWHPVCYL